MILITGGKYEGEENFAGKNWPSKKQIFDTDERIKNLVSGMCLSEAEDLAKKFAEEFAIENKDAIIFLPEVGCGLVPLSSEDRIFREAVGRAGCVFAEIADKVYVVTMGIGQRIK